MSVFNFTRATDWTVNEVKEHGEWTVTVDGVRERGSKMPKHEGGMRIESTASSKVAYLWICGEKRSLALLPYHSLLGSPSHISANT